MEFGRLERVDHVDFSLPPPVCTKSAAARAARVVRDTQLGVRLGAPAWGRRSWVGRVYPPRSTPDTWLAAYASHYDAIELNSTFYAVPPASTIDAWVAAVPPSFRFCPKLPKTVSHARGLGVGTEPLARAIDAFSRFGEKLGPVWLQAPPQLGPRELPQVAAFLAQWPRTLPLAVELRDPAWFAAGYVAPAVADLLAAFDVGLVTTDVAGRRDVAHGTVTSKDAFVRFVGNAHPSDAPRLDAWAVRLGELARLGVERAWFFVHQPDDEAAPETLAFAATRFESVLGVPVAAWRGDSSEHRTAAPAPCEEPPPSPQLGLFGAR